MKRLVVWALALAGAVVVVFIATLVLLPKDIRLSGQLIKNGQPAVADGTYDMEVQLYDLLDLSRLAFADSVKGDVKDGRFELAVKPPGSIMSSPTVAVICINEGRGTSDEAPICQSAGQTSDTAVVCSPYYIEANALSWTNRLMGHNKVSATDSLDKCADDDSATIGKTVNIGGFANAANNQDLSKLRDQVDEMQVKLGETTGLVSTHITDVTNETIDETDETTVQAGLRSLDGNTPINVGGTDANPVLSITACAANQTYVSTGSSWQCQAVSGSLTFVGGTNITVTGTNTITVSTVNNPTFSGDTTVGGNFTLNGAIMPGGLAGVAGQVLVSNGPGLAPIWASADGTCNVNGPHFCQSGNGFGVAAVLGTNDNFALHFKTNNATHMTVLPNGNVGVGVTNPGEKLDVNGDLRLLAQGGLRFADTNSSNYVAFRAPGTVNSDVTWTLPGADGTNAQALITNGSGTLSWGAPAAAQTTPISGLTNATGTNALTSPFTQTWSFTPTTGNGLVINDGGGNTNTGFLLQLETESGSDMAPLNVIANGHSVFSILKDTEGIDIGGVNSLGDVTLQSAGGVVVTANAGLSIGRFNGGRLLSMMDEGPIRFYDNNSSKFVGFKAPASVTTDTTWTLPGADGTNGQVLTTNGSGVLSWAAANDASVPINNLAAATGTNTIDNTNFAQTWNWNSLAAGNGLELKSTANHTGSLLSVETSSTGASTNGLVRYNFTGNHTGAAGFHIDDVTSAGTVMSILASGLTTGTALNVAVNSDGLNSALGALVVDNIGSSTNGILARFRSNAASASSGLTVLANSNVGVNTAAPDTLFHVEGAKFGATKTNPAQYLAYINNTDVGNEGNLLLMRSNNTTFNGNLRMIGFMGQTTELGSISVNGSGNVVYNTTSDARLKTNVTGTNYSIEDLMKLNVVDFDWKNGGDRSNGFIAQDVNSVYPYAVTPGNGDGAWMMDYGRLTPLVVKSVQDLNLKIGEQAVQIEELKKAVFNGGIVGEDTTFKGLIKFEGEVRLSGKNAGSATVKAGKRWADVVFPSSLSGTPQVTIGKYSEGDYFISRVSRNGFRIELPSPQTKNMRFDWHAFVPEQ